MKMRNPFYTKQFSKDIKKMQKRGKDMEKIKKLLSLLIENKPLDLAYKDHKLTGNFEGRRDCHVEPDWILIYKLDKENIVFERTGTHADLFE